MLEHTMKINVRWWQMEREGEGGALKYNNNSSKIKI